MLKVLDVSYYNTITSWQKVKENVDAVIIRIGYRGCTTGKIVYDEMFTTFLNACKQHGIPYAGYYFPCAITDAEADEEGDFVARAVKTYGMDLALPIFADSEVVKSDRSGRADKLTKERRTRYLNRFLMRLKAAGIPYGVYASTYWFKDCLIDSQLLADTDRWVAQYAGKCTYKGGYLLWQYTSKAQIPGVKGACDMSYLYGALMGPKEQKADTAAEIIEKATKWMEDTAADSAHGYDQLYRWGEKGDYDCSSAVITAWQYYGVPVKNAGATYTGNMLQAMLKCGFVDVTGSINLKTGSGLKRGDVLLNTAHHTAMYCGNGKEVEASINEYGKARGGKPGDQTGKEFLVRTYRNYPWTYVLRFKGEASGSYRTPDKKVDFVGVVNTKKDPLNVRKGPGTSYAKCQTFGPLAKGTVIDVCDTVKDSSGAAWYYICYRGAKYGFVKADYIRKK